MVYDYKASKKRTEDILNRQLNIKTRNKLPKNNSLLFNNPYHSWVTCIFINIQNKTDIFCENSEEESLKIIHSFTSEIIEILRDDVNLREVGVRGYSIYAVCTTPSKEDIYEVSNKSFYINTYIKMLNKLLLQNGYSLIEAGIGVATVKELVIKAGNKNSGINNNMWLEDSITKASELSLLVNKRKANQIIFSELSYNNFIEAFMESHGGTDNNWFTEHYSNKYGGYYRTSIVESNFSKWIDDGMAD